MHPVCRLGAAEISTVLIVYGHISRRCAPEATDALTLQRQFSGRSAPPAAMSTWTPVGLTPPIAPSAGHSQIYSPQPLCLAPAGAHSISSTMPPKYVVSILRVAERTAKLGSYPSQGTSKRGTMVGRWVRIDRRYNQPYRLTGYAVLVIFKWTGLVLAGPGMGIRQRRPDCESPERACPSDHSGHHLVRRPLRAAEPKTATNPADIQPGYASGQPVAVRANERPVVAVRAVEGPVAAQSAVQLASAPAGLVTRIGLAA